MRHALAALLALTATAAHAEYRPMKVDLDPDGKSFVRINTWHQVWLRYAEQNPGTAVNGVEETDDAFDIGMRRSRVLIHGQLTPRLTMVTHFGFDNQTFDSGKKPALFMHDAFVQYDVVPDILTLGGGLHYFNGVSRMTSASTQSFLAIDAPTFNWPTIERSDQFGRMYGIYAKGRLASLDYRLSVNQPFKNDDKEPTERGDYNSRRHGLSYAAYLSYAFADLEPNTLPYTTGTWLGKKRVFNIGAGGYYEPDGVAWLEDGDRQTDALAALGVDLFFDQPIGDAGALTAYLVWYRYDFGPDNLRMAGTMNTGEPATTGPDGDGAPAALSLNGPGNSYPVLGTGDQLYALAGWLLPVALGDTRFQPYAAISAGLFDALDEPSLVFEGGLNILLYGHQAKLTAHLRNRPIFTLQDGEALVDSRANEVILQTQMAF
ncbi:MAG: hypothetical protein R3F65_14010 [bacterium]|nr:hypothetical protein [Myxococcales bacterium]